MEMSRTEFKHRDIFMYKPQAEKSIVSHCSSQYALISLVHKHYKKRKWKGKKTNQLGEHCRMSWRDYK